MRHERATLPTPTSTNSFWHSEPNEYLIGHRTTEDLPAEADIVIVGSGITGTGAASYLAEDARANGKSIVMLEAREACWGATGRNGGHCQPLLFDRSSDVAEFELKNVAALRSYIQENNVPCEWRDVVGCRTFWTEEALKEAEKEIDHLRKVAPEVAKNVRVIKDKEEFKKHRIAPDCVGATLSQGAASLWPYKLITFALEQLVKDGQINLQTKTPVTEITSAEDKHTLHTPRGTISSKTVILATNGYTSAILPHFADLIVPCRGEMSALFPPEGSTLLPNSYGMVAALGQPANNDDYLVQRPYEGVPNPAGHLMFGGGRGAGNFPSIGISDDSVIDEGSAAYLRGALLKVLELDGQTEGLQELKAAGQWTGIMGYSRDDHPWVGKVPDKEGLWLCGGYTGHGMPNGTLCGKAVVDMVLGEMSGHELSAVQAQMVEKGDMPKSYILTKERIDRARQMLTVQQQDATGVHMNGIVSHAIDTTPLQRYPLRTVSIHHSFTSVTMPVSPLPSKIGVVLFPGFQLLDFAGPMDAFNILSYDHPLTLYTIASTLDPVSTHNFLQKERGSQISQTLVPTHTFDTAPDDLEVLLIPGGLGARSKEQMKPVVEYLEKLDMSGEGKLRWVLTVCTGSEILARTGVLDGRRATTNKKAFNDVKATHPRVEWVPKARWVVDGNFWTSSGISAGMDLAFAWIAHVFGEEKAQYVADRSEYERNVEAGNDRYAERWGAV
ncbi:fad dependent oxidoreductase [Stemphylium lycopersici]|uniref:Fad dependent oxidoreductase n=1 Tax=Stemphylium lycopersici TaxID=183478 RepID=A0A364NBD2_STELY|nr:fad dependent oxidoreductase [Stemphylium lycopersici]RAQ99747.1 fad dependent oxidoreductase [Stemphylium lycopersici]RAR14664.1 fad dependent oxidoreductase [Stemphylium lycopersici]